jgi:uncharacterized lipoprotein YehR (DUF1307 family)
MKKLKVFSLLALILALGLILAGCGGDAESDTWSAVTSFDQLNGTWKGSKSEKHTYKEWYAIWEDTWTDYMEALYGNMSMEHKLDYVIVINSAVKTYSMTGVETQIYSGEKIASAWPVMLTWTWNGDQPVINDKDHSFSWTWNNEPVTVTDNWLQNFQVNQNGKKIKVLKWFNDGTDLIFTK